MAATRTAAGLSGADLEQIRWWSWRRQRLDRSSRGIDDCLALRLLQHARERARACTAGCGRGDRLLAAPATPRVWWPGSAPICRRWNRLRRFWKMVLSLPRKLLYLIYPRLFRQSRKLKLISLSQL